MKVRILIVEDQSIEANNLKIILRKEGYHVCSIAANVPQALGIIEDEKPDLALLDIRLSGAQTGIDLARQLQTRDMPFVFLSANADVQTLKIAKATKPYGFLVKPFRQKDVLVMIDVALYLHREKQGRPPEPVADLPIKQAEFPEIIGRSPQLLAVLHQVDVVARAETSVLILGESGTGKELIAKAIHRISGRADMPFVTVSCGALPASLIESELFGHEKGSFTGASEQRIGKFEQADGGTIFLDEIGELPADLQVKFLRVLQEHEIEPIGGKTRPVNVRVIAATNRNLEEEIAKGQFRMDLYYRLNVFPVTLPALRDRPTDILPLASYFISQFAARQNKAIDGLSDQAIEVLLGYAWPGNIRELENLMERCVLLASGGRITSVPLPYPPKKQPPPPGGERLKTISENERDHIVAALQKCGGKIYGADGAAALLDINGSTLHSRMKKLGIEKTIVVKPPDA